MWYLAKLWSLYFWKKTSLHNFLFCHSVNSRIKLSKKNCLANYSPCWFLQNWKQNINWKSLSPFTRRFSGNVRPSQIIAYMSGNNLISNCIQNWHWLKKKSVFAKYERGNKKLLFPKWFAENLCLFSLHVKNLYTL